jgi:hypothetical protein
MGGFMFFQITGGYGMLNGFRLRAPWTLIEAGIESWRQQREIGDKHKALFHQLMQSLVPASPMVVMLGLEKEVPDKPGFITDYGPQIIAEIMGRYGFDPLLVSTEPRDETDHFGSHMRPIDYALRPRSDCPAPIRELLLCKMEEALAENVELLRKRIDALRPASA